VAATVAERESIRRQEPQRVQDGRIVRRDPDVLEALEKLGDGPRARHEPEEILGQCATYPRPAIGKIGREVRRRHEALLPEREPVLGVGFGSQELVNPDGDCHRPESTHARQLFL